MIYIENLKKAFGKKVILNNCSLQLSAGNIYGFVGKNGAGKTTFFNCISGMESYKGNITYDKGILKNILGFLPTTPYFFSKITGYEYLELMCLARKIPFEKNHPIFHFYELPLNQFAENYSTGMQKKLAILGVLIQQNDVFILDEPFNGLDIESNLKLSEHIFNLKKQGRTILLSSHILSSLNELCDEIFLLENGQFSRYERSLGYDSIKDRMSRF